MGTITAVTAAPGVGGYDTKGGPGHARAEPTARRAHQGWTDPPLCPQRQGPLLAHMVKASLAVVTGLQVELFLLQFGVWLEVHGCSPGTEEWSPCVIVVHVI